jgi:hypothetical protein
VEKKEFFLNRKKKIFSDFAMLGTIIANEIKKVGK